MILQLSPRPRSTRQLALILTVYAVLALALLAAVAVLTLQIYFDASQRARLHRELDQVSQILAGVDDTAALAAMPEQMAAAFGHQSALAVRIQNSLGQPLYQKRRQAALPPALLAQPALAPPAPLVTWRSDDGYWRGSALVMRMPLEGAAPLTVVVALPIERERGFLQSFRLVLAAYVVLASLSLAGLAWWASRGNKTAPVDAQEPKTP